ncbi:MAG: hypothetical protein LBP56_08305 [Odoribacteraceae bacterium]|jgi:C-terminal processing protease CtpA/Prc|nr:hypothetical protein [Odoribacteraceae bacterium]
MTRFYVFLWSACLGVFFTACEKESNEEKKSKAERLHVNEFIAEVMDYYYLWNDRVPHIRPNAATDPRDYLNSLLYKDDHWSYLTDDKERFLEEEITRTGESSGYDLSFGRFGDRTIFAIVNYVYPGSPAAAAGIKRGDFILQLNKAALTDETYMELYNAGTHLLTLGKYEGGGQISATVTVTVTSVKMDQNPVLINKVVTEGTHKIGYLMYTGFVSNFKQQLIDALTGFKEEQITDLVLDLRYNPGGEIDVATLLCSAIVPPAQMKRENILIKHQWNAQRQAEYENAERENPEEYKGYLSTCFEEVSYNLGLSRVYVLTSRSSASASELLVVGLEAYMDVIQIGDTTHGKYTAMVLISPTDKTIEKWMLLPVVYKFMNAKGKTDFKDGLSPLYLLPESLPFSPLGDLDEPLLAKAIALITGQETEAAKPFSEEVTWLTPPPRRVLEGYLLYRWPDGKSGSLLPFKQQNVK